MRAVALELKHELIGLAGVVERNVYLTRRYIYWDLAFFVWTVANTLTIVFIAKGIEASGGNIDVDRATTTLLIGAVVWAYLGIIFEFLTETVAWERWEGTIEYTFMAPISRLTHLLGQAAFAMLYGILHTSIILAILALFFQLDLSQANVAGMLLIVVTGSMSFVGLGMFAAVIWNGVQISLTARSHFGRLLAMGVTLNFFLYIMINGLMVMGLIPVVGIPMPLVSYGGTAMMTVMIGFGLLMGVHVHRQVTVPSHSSGMI